MRDQFREWYPNSDSEQATLLREGTIVFDTSSLLTLYRLSESDRKRVLELMDVMSSRLWMPYQVGLEFHRNRLEVVYDQIYAYAEVISEIAKLRKQIESYRVHPVLSQTRIKREIIDRLVQLERYVKRQKEELHPTDIADPRTEDGVLSALTKLFRGKTGDRIDRDATELASAKTRYDRSIPPGYRDVKKPEPERYGDLFVWLETLQHVAGSQDAPRSLILVTEDAKEDWWRLDPRTQTKVGPRPELVREAYELHVSPFWLTSLERFFTEGAAVLGWESTRLGDFAPVTDLSQEEEAEPATYGGAATILAERTDVIPDGEDVS